MKQIVDFDEHGGGVITGDLVRCKECKHHEDEELGMVYCPKIVGSWVSENWYCADGEREVQG